MVCGLINKIYSWDCFFKAIHILGLVPKTYLLVGVQGTKI